MKTLKLVLAGFVVLSICTAGVSFAAGPGMRGGGSCGWGTGSKYGRMYNPQTVETVSGKVVMVDKVTPMKGMSSGIHLVLSTDKGDVSVHLGPAWYIDRQDTSVKAGDTVEVKGSRVEIAGKPVVIAAEVKKGDETLMLRDESGIPLWSGWRRR
jgi:hypothetical protein